MNDSELKEVVISKQQIYDGKIMDVQRWKVKLPNGNESFREIVLHKGASAIVPLDDEGNVYLVNQYRTPVGKVLCEIPAGKLDYAEEDHFEAAKRELKEETGFVANSWTHLTDMVTTPGFTNELISIYLAQGLTKGDTEFDEDEFITLEKLPLKDAVAKIYSGEIIDSKTIAGLLLTYTRLHGE